MMTHKGRKIASKYKTSHPDCLLILDVFLLFVASSASPANTLDFFKFFYQSSSPLQKLFLNVSAGMKICFEFQIFKAIFNVLRKNLFRVL